MIVFWSIAALLLACALGFIILPLIRKSRAAAGVTRDAVNVSVYRDQLRELDADLEAGTMTPERHAETRREIEGRLLEDTAGGAAAAERHASGAKRAAAAVAISIPALAFGMYFAVGSPQLVSLSKAQLAAGGTAHGFDAQQIEVMVTQLAARLQANPDDAQGWVMLGRTYAALDRFQEASAAYANAASRITNDAQLLADYADVLAMAQGQRLQGEPEKLIARALAIDPDNIKALALAGTAAFVQQDYARALVHWERILRIAPADSELMKSVRASIDEAKKLAGRPGAPSAAAPPAPSAPSAPPKRAEAGEAAKTSAASVSGVVQLAPELAAKVVPTDTVFVFARPAEGSRMPLAILRAQAKDLPLKFTLDDGAVSMGGEKISSQRLVVVGARISRSGSAVPQPGDVQGFSAPVAPGAAGLRIVISDVAK